MLSQRLITGPLLIVLLLVVVAADDWLEGVELRGLAQQVFQGRTHFPRGLLLLGLALVGSALAAVEFTAIVAANGIKARPWLTAMAAVAGVLLSYCVPNDTSATHAIAIVSTGLVSVFIISLLIFSQNKNVQGVLAAAGAVVFAMVYLGFMLGFVLALRRWHSAWLVAGIVLTTKMCDTGAFFTGMAIGRHKLIPWLSPGKTWEGLAGGALLASAAGAGLAAASTYLPPSDQVPIWLGAVGGCALAIVGQFGDLTMSLFKRGAGIKDSSALLPGLGGVLDVLDSPLMVAPLAFWIIELATS